jgi:hypothetical protein
VGRDHAGAVAGFLMMVGNLGGTAYVLVVQGLLADPMLAVAALMLLVAPWPLLARAHRPAPAATRAAWSADAIPRAGRR